MRQKTSDLRQLLATTIHHVRSGRATSRTNLARFLGISPSTVGLYVDQLIATGHLHESGLEHGSMGRPKRKLMVRSTPGWFAGVEFTADRVQFIGVDFSGQIINTQEIPLHADPSTAIVLDTIKTGLNQMSAQQSIKLLGIGMGAPGWVDSVSGLSIRYTFVHDWQNIPIRDILGEKFGVPVTLESSMRAIALAERWFGNHRNVDDYLVVAARSGFGLASMQAGKLIHGANNSAGEVGLWPWPLAGEGPVRELHHMLSAPMTYRRLAGLSETTPVPKNLRVAMLSLANERLHAWDEVVTDYARVLGCVQLLLDPKLCFLHGPLTALGDRFCQDVMDASTQIAPALATVKLNLIRSTLGDDAGALGAASLAMEAWLPKYV